MLPSASSTPPVGVAMRTVSSRSGCRPGRSSSGISKVFSRSPSRKVTVEATSV
jgi:hypothetical protein